MLKWAYTSGILMGLLYVWEGLDSAIVCALTRGCSAWAVSFSGSYSICGIRSGWREWRRRKYTQKPWDSIIQSHTNILAIGEDLEGQEGLRRRRIGHTIEEGTSRSANMDWLLKRVCFFSVSLIAVQACRRGALWRVSARKNRIALWMLTKEMISLRP